MPRVGQPLVYVDQLRDWGWVIRGRKYASCHMFVTPLIPLEVLHRFAESLGLKRQWFQTDSDLPHYDLIPSKRALAVRLGAIEASDRFMVAQMRLYREKVNVDRASQGP